ncbi:Peptidoglycan-binding Lysin subgroup [Penicillium macrosclerotiorum]|uniref:Peptidoglycan-binding Lysin subgroup n=1 Tax=Penicillium macrosclerotiorum TaxID=303699 RepID=UPI002546FACF|nr:Peptidoglycan-binding Lysin subgroup [Penicillium macrosclerotiorum]KAJ5668977.1 Peptidoglycan-binding Lysin subgroup [Penicillium macrosclerotiorum]
MLIIHIAVLLLWSSILSTVTTAKLDERSPAVSPSSDGVCYTYTIQAGDSCASVAQKYEITTDQIETVNAQTWGWSGCKKFHQGSFICLSAGEPPMPVSLPHAVCGPQVPGTARPLKYSDLRELNLCPKSQCCSNAGKCGTTSDFCSQASGCISNCNADSSVAFTSESDKSSTETSATTMKEVSSAITTTSIKSMTTTTSTKSTTTTTSTQSTTTTTSTKSTTTESTETIMTESIEQTASAETAKWQIAMYSESGCKGDYYLLQGHNTVGGAQCVSLHGRLSTSVTDTGISCRWWTDGGFSWTDCDSSSLKQPKSWYITNGECWVYPTDQCVQKDYSGEIYRARIGCQDIHTSALEPYGEFGGLKCSRMVPE